MAGGHSNGLPDTEATVGCGGLMAFFGGLAKRRRPARAAWAAKMRMPR